MVTIDIYSKLLLSLSTDTSLLTFWEWCFLYVVADCHFSISTLTLMAECWKALKASQGRHTENYFLRPLFSWFSNKHHLSRIKIEACIWKQSIHWGKHFKTLTRKLKIILTLVQFLIWRTIWDLIDLSVIEWSVEVLWLFLQSCDQNINRAFNSYEWLSNLVCFCIFISDLWIFIFSLRFLNFY